MSANSTFTPGQRVKTLLGETETDCQGNERHTAAGTVGWIEAFNHADGQGVKSWNVSFPNGAAVIITDDELRDPKQYTTWGADDLRTTCLRLRYGLDVQELSMLDDEMIGNAQELVDSAGAIIRTIDLCAKQAAEVVQLRAALQSIVDARDHCAEHGSYPAGSLTSDQGFDDWAADIASAALEG